jgi:hypothetical protein
MCTKLLHSYVIFHWLEWLVLILPTADDIPVGSNVKWECFVSADTEDSRHDSGSQYGLWFCFMFF